MFVSGFIMVENMTKRLSWLILSFAMLLGSAPAAWAVLGQPVASVENDRQRMQGELRQIPDRGFTVQQITTPARIVVKEYVSPSGVVFGVSWRGPSPPDLSQLLGNYFPQFRQAASVRPRVRTRHLSVHTDQLVVETGGHMRDLRGRAYVPALVPPGVSQASIE